MPKFRNYDETYAASQTAQDHIPELGEVIYVHLDSDPTQLKEVRLGDGTTRFGDILPSSLALTSQQQTKLDNSFDKTEDTSDEITEGATNKFSKITSGTAQVSGTTLTFEDAKIATLNLSAPLTISAITGMVTGGVMMLEITTNGNAFAFSTGLVPADLQGNQEIISGKLYCTIKVLNASTPVILVEYFTKQTGGSSIESITWDDANSRFVFTEGGIAKYQDMTPILNKFDPDFMPSLQSATIVQADPTKIDLLFNGVVKGSGFVGMSLGSGKTITAISGYETDTLRLTVSVAYIAADGNDTFSYVASNETLKNRFNIPLTTNITDFTVSNPLVGTPTLDQEVYINFNQYGGQVVSPNPDGNSKQWNNTTVAPSTTGTIIADMVNASNVATGFALVINNPFDGSSTSGEQTGDNTGFGGEVPDSAIDIAFRAQSSGDGNANLQITGLDNAKTYDLKFACSLLGTLLAGYDATTVITIGGSSQSVDARPLEQAGGGNTQNFIEFTGIAPSSGQITFDVDMNAGAGNRVAVLNAMILKEYS